MSDSYKAIRLFSLVGPGRIQSDRFFRLRPAKKDGHIGSDQVWQPMKKNVAKGVLGYGTKTG